MRNSDKMPAQISEDATAVEAALWVRRIVRFVGPGFHPDTPFDEYVRIGDGSCLFAPGEAELLQANLDRAWAILDRAGIEIYSVALRTQRQLLKARGVF